MRTVIKRDPPMKRLGRGRYVCALEGCEEELNEITIKNLDPFHAGECARAFHDVEIAINPTKRGVPVAASS